jgi:hypothetical protein
MKFVLLLLFAGYFSFCHSVEIGSETHPHSYPKGIRGLFPWGVKRPRREGDYNHPYSAEVKKDGSITKLPFRRTWRGA